uniref:Uncharacterized protein n=1 Tax=Arundo donax TaxID=35708 RepID=A0A0A8ZVT1_ARUDO
MRGRLHRDPSASSRDLLLAESRRTEPASHATQAEDTLQRR